MYLAVHSRTWQSKASTLTPVCWAMRPVWSGSAAHEPASIEPLLTLLEVCDPWLAPPPCPLLPLLLPLPPLPLLPLPFAPLPHPERTRASAQSAAATRAEPMCLPSMFIGQG